jgi:NAD(P)-dependent dehydrogenase (short-subunit alcohol dehydrogenase family)
VATLEKTSVRRSNMVQGFVADFCDFDEVRRFATEVIEALEGRPVLTGLINNAGVYEKQFHKIGGLEKTWKVNVAAPYLLTSLLINTVLQERVINVASISAANHIDFHNLQQVISG